MTAVWELAWSYNDILSHWEAVSFTERLVLHSYFNLVIPIQNSLLLSSNKIELACSDGFLRDWYDLDSVLHLQLCRNVLLFSISETFFNVATIISQTILTTKMITGLRIIWNSRICSYFTAVNCMLYWHRCFLRVLNSFPCDRSTNAPYSYFKKKTPFHSIWCVFFLADWIPELYYMIL